jgi:hypothetical protein
MRNLIYIVAVILIIGWAIGFFAFQVGLYIYFVIAVIVIVVKLIQSN